MHRVPVIIVASMDVVLRDTVATNLLCDLPGALVLRHDLTPDGVLHRGVYDTGGVRERAHSVLDHGCLSCALREDVLPTLARLVEDSRRRPDAVVLALPVTASPTALHRALAPAPGAPGSPGPLTLRPLAEPAVPGAVAAGVVAAVDTATLLADLFGDDLLAERGAELSVDDRRAVGEALAEQVECADVVAVPAPPAAQPARVLAHLTASGTSVQPVDALDVAALLRSRPADGDPRGDVRRTRPSGAPDGDGVWTLDLRSPRPLHPERLLDALPTLGTGPLRGRGVFWLSTRPDTACAWDGAGGQLSIGSVGRWGQDRRSHLVITGVDHDPEPLVRAFRRVLLTDAEIAAGLSCWAGRSDGLDAWLGERRTTP